MYLIENDRMAKVAFRLSPAYQGNRFMTEALARVAIFCFEETELQRLWADVHTQNIASYKTLEKVGFKREGLIREGKMVNIYCDYYLYGMTISRTIHHFAVFTLYLLEVRLKNGYNNLVLI